MSQEVFCVLKELNFHNIATQLALQCAPVIAGVTVYRKQRYNVSYIQKMGA